MLDDITEKINAILPQTQCGKCDFSGCKPYAKAISEGKADINQCPPGGKNGIVKIAKLLQVEYKPLNKKYGNIKPKSTAIIKEDDCIGCTLCILACPVDAILGAKDCNKRDQPVLVGTTSIENSELISKQLSKAKLEHQVLNAKQHEKEAHNNSQIEKTIFCILLI